MSRPMLLALGLGVLALAWAPLTDAVLGHGFAAHMTRHMGVVAVAAPLIALAVVGSERDPSRRWPLLFSAVPVSLVELLVVWGWHAPAAHDLARTSAVAFAAEQASFLLAGLWLWIACFGHAGDQRQARAAQGLIAMLLTTIHMTLLGVLLATGSRALYGAHHHGAGDALAGQQLGGIVMLLVGGAVYLAGGLALGARLLRDDGFSESERAPPPTSPQRGGVDRRSRAGEGDYPYPEMSKTPHPALRADLSPPGRGEERTPPDLRPRLVATAGNASP